MKFSEFNLLDEAAQRQFKRKGSELIRKFRCTSGPKKGKLVASPMACAQRKDPKKIRHGKKVMRSRKGLIMRKSKISKGKAISRLVAKINLRLSGKKKKLTESLSGDFEKAIAIILRREYDLAERFIKTIKDDDLRERLNVLLNNDEGKYDTNKSTVDGERVREGMSYMYDNTKRAALGVLGKILDKELRAKLAKFIDNFNTSTNPPLDS